MEKNPAKTKTNKRKDTQEDFLRKATELYAEQYVYDKVDYKNSKTPVTITCPEHGDFQMNPGRFLLGNPCPECRKENSRLERQDTFIEQAREKHGDRYDYSKVHYTGNVAPVTIICSIHGEFEQTPSVHKSGYGCQKCGAQKETSSMTNAEFIAAAKKIHGDTYDYSLVPKTTGSVYSRHGTFICAEHGEFRQTYHKHLEGQGCRQCSYENRNGLKLEFDEVVARSREAHGDKYTYLRYESPNVVYLCPTHGEISQSAQNHFKGHGCGACGNGLKKSQDDFIAEARQVYGDKYTYERTEYKGNKTSVKVTCPEHGLFRIQPGCLLRGEGCPDCAGRSRAYDEEIFLQEAEKVHPEYSYSGFVHTQEYVTVTCPKHGDWRVRVATHIRGNKTACPGCAAAKTTSKQHQQVIDWLEGENLEINTRRELDSGQELDIYLPERKLAIEINGLYWHSAKYKPNDYHYNKFNEARSQGITLLQFWDNEVREQPDVVKSMIDARLGKSKRIFARKCVVRALPQQVYGRFLLSNHLQGEIPSAHRLGLFFEGELVAVLGLSRRERDAYHIDRFCTEKGITVVGGFSKLLAQVKKGITIVTFSDNRYSTGEVYKSSGFGKIGENNRTLYFTDGPNLFSRQTFMRHKLEKYFGKEFPKEMTASEICAAHGIYEVWGPGTMKWRKQL